ncbi:MAG: hypothetical protein DBY05_09940 [Clostridiales bacterium]|nr:MAG: hypothetical protein DBY05_09940 [Clostridiales bacterium]
MREASFRDRQSFPRGRRTRRGYGCRIRRSAHRRGRRAWEYSRRCPPAGRSNRAWSRRGIRRNRRR